MSYTSPRRNNGRKILTKAKNRVLIGIIPHINTNQLNKMIKHWLGFKRITTSFFLTLKHCSSSHKLYIFSQKIDPNSIVCNNY